MTNKQHIIFGGKGFIGQNLANQILTKKEKILIIDKNRWGIDYKINEIKNNVLCKTIEVDINLDFGVVHESIRDFVEDPKNTTAWHLAANSDISAGNKDIKIDLEDTFLTTVRIIKLCQMSKIRTINFASSSAVYGDAPHGLNGFSELSSTQPISNYGVMKLASEGVLKVAFQTFLDKCIVYRFPNVIGTPATHGVIKDFVEKLRKNPRELRVLGNGEQNKPYLHVSDLVDAMLYLSEQYTKDRYFEIINLGSPFENVYVRQIAEEVCTQVSPSANIIYGDTPYGWIGDMPKVDFDLNKLMKTGWNCKLSGLDAVKLTISDINKE